MGFLGLWNVQALSLSRLHGMCSFGKEHVDCSDGTIRLQGGTSDDMFSSDVKDEEINGGGMSV